MSSWSSSVLGWDLVVPRIGEGLEVSVGAVDPGRQCQECPLGSPAGSWRWLGGFGLPMPAGTAAPSQVINSGHQLTDSA